MNGEYINMDMYKWIEDIIKAEKVVNLPVISFPGFKITNTKIEEAIKSADAQAVCMKNLVDRFDMVAGISCMDLSVEAEAFGAGVTFHENDLPHVESNFVKTYDDANNLAIPSMDAGRLPIFIEAIKKASATINERPIFANIIGPFSLAGRLTDITEIMIKCLMEPETAHLLLKKSTEFIIKYALALKEAGANGFILAEPVAGLLSPEMDAEFASSYVKEIVDAVQDENFIVIYHNCGNVVELMDSILTVGAKAYHFGNAIKLIDVIDKVPENCLVMGNIDPVDILQNGTKELIIEETTKLLEELKEYKNFVISTGCDVPESTSLENIEIFYRAVEVFNFKQ